MKVIIKNGLVIDPKNDREGFYDILIENFRVKKIENDINENANYIIDAKEMIVAPGFVDIHANFCDPGITSKEDLKTGSLSSSKGGYTYVILGVDNKPAPSECNVIEYIKKYSMIMPINLYPSGTITKGSDGEEISDIQFLFNHGAIGFYDGLNPIMDKNILENAMSICKSINVPISVYSEDIENVKNRGINKGEISKKLSIASASPYDSEEKDLEKNIECARITNAKVDFAFVTTKNSVNLIEKAKKENMDIFCEVPAINLILTENELNNKKINHGFLKLLPTLKTEADRKALIKGLKQGTIDIISSNHVPCLDEEKDLKLKDCKCGSIGLETVLGICGKILVNKEKFKWSQVIEKISVNPAKLFSLSNAGGINIGGLANITIFDPNEKWVLTSDTIVSKSKNTPLIGMELIGKVKYTICNGRLVYEDNLTGNNNASI